MKLACAAQAGIVAAGGKIEVSADCGRVLAATGQVAAAAAAVPPGADPLFGSDPAARYRNLRAQIDACFDDFRIWAVKLGMLANKEVIDAVANALEHHKPPHIVVDPVMVATSGARLLEAAALDAGMPPGWKLSSATAESAGSCIVAGPSPTTTG